MNRPQLSVIVPVYNVEKYLSKCIESILNQTFIDFELLLINDGSTDGSRNIIEYFKLKDARIRAFYTDNNGVSCARNFGIEQALGEWICFVDSDDWIEPTHFTNYFITKLSSDTIVYQGINFNYEREQISFPFFKYDDNTILISDEKQISKYRILHNGCPYCKLFNLNLIKTFNIRFNPDISIHEDHCFVWQYLEHINHIELREECSYHYMKRGTQSLTSKHHTTKEYLIGGHCLLNALSIIKRRANLKNEKYLGEINDNFGMMQLLEAIVFSESNELESTITRVRQIINNFPEFKFGSIKKKLAISTLIFAPKILQQIIHSIIKHYKK